METKRFTSFIYILVSILFLEIAIKYLMFNRFFHGLLTIILFSLPFVLVLSLCSRLFKNIKINRGILLASIIILTVWFELQYLFYTLFSTPFSFITLSMTSQALDFTNIVFETIWQNIGGFILLLLPLLGLIIFGRKMEHSKCQKNSRNLLIILIIVFYGINLLCVIPGRNKLNTLGNLYFYVNNQSEIIDKFGILTASKIDLKRIITGYEEPIIVYEEKPKDIEGITEETEFNEILNFEELIAAETNANLLAMHKYFDSTASTNKNEYTGMYKDKNLIFILAEGFNSIAVSEELTPTLYKLSNSSFVFENFYSPVFLSTTGGEFQATTGLVPTLKVLNTFKENKTQINYGLGNVFNDLGYKTYGYHNWTYTYYKRHDTNAALGFKNYMGCGNGMQKIIDCEWLPSDIDMIESTTPLYLTGEKFATYYVTVSGHAPYVLSNGNSIALKNKELVADLPYNTSIKAYLATQIELDRALEKLLQDLQTAGELENTVIALVGDHYPYTLTLDEINTISTYKRDSIIEVNRSNFILWSSDTEKQVITKVGSQIDVLPTLLNLFGIEYDSRIIVGNDILSDNPGLAIFSNRSWVSDKGSYFAKSKKFVARDDMEIDNEYIKAMNTRVANSFTISEKIINYNYYEKVLGSVVE